MNRIFLLLMLVNVPGFFYGQAAPFTTPPESLLVYNTSLNFDITPGFFYWRENKWLKIPNSGEVWEILFSCENYS